MMYSLALHTERSARYFVPMTRRSLSIEEEMNFSRYAEIDLNVDGGSFFLRARLNVSVPGVDREVAQELVDAAHKICPYSKATHGNIEVETTLV
jgi:organic hydroperoxide reductase OsmC/OhrA